MPNETLETGQAIRREVLGSDYVDHRAATAWPFVKPHQDLLTEYIRGCGVGASWFEPPRSQPFNLGMLADDL